MPTIGEIANAGGPAAMLLIWGLTHWRDRNRERHAEIGVAAVDRTRLDRIDRLGEALNTHLLECARTNAEHADAIAALIKSTDRLDRSVGQLQGQIQLAIRTEAP